MRQFLIDWRRRLPVVLFALAFAAILYAIQVIPLFGQSPGGLRGGEIVQQDIRSPISVSFISSVLTEQAREKAVVAVPERYGPPDATIVRQQLTRAGQALDFIDSVRNDPYATPEQARSWLMSIQDVKVSPQIADQIMAFNAADWKDVESDIPKVIDQVLRDPVKENQVQDAQDRIPALVSLQLSLDQANIVVAIARQFIVPNSYPNAALTDQARQQARDSVQPVMRTIDRGQIILHAGDRVDQGSLEALEQVGLQTAADPWRVRASAALLSLTLATLLTISIAAVDPILPRMDPQLAHSLRPILLMILLFSLFTGAVRLVIIGHTLLPYLYPASALALMIGALLSPTLGALAALALGIMVGYLGNGSLEMAIFIILTGVAGAITLGRAERLTSFFRAGAMIALVGSLVVLIFRLPDATTDMRGLLQLVPIAIANGGLSASLAIGGIYFLGGIFDITTSIQLYELARPNHPLLQALLRNAPGSYHHSLMVGNLAEQAAEQIGANSLLIRVGAFYHDIGKIARPYFFIENQIDNPSTNVHDRLDPHTSAEVLISHVRDGLELARRYRLPGRIKAFIPEHHGTTRVSFLYQQAVQQAGDDSLIDEKSFRYPGPRPQSKETALLMLADGCEAAVRSAHPSSVEEIEQIVGKVIADRLNQGQLDECGLTLRDLDRIRSSFVSTLRGMFHPRLKYPEPAREQVAQQTAAAELGPGQPAGMLPQPQASAGPVNGDSQGAQDAPSSILSNGSATSATEHPPLKEATNQGDGAAIPAEEATSGE